MGACAKFVRGLALFLQVGVAAAVIGITLAHLDDYNVQNGANDITFTEQCALGPTSLYGGDLGWCTVNYIVAGVSIAATLVLGLLMCLTCDCCGAGPVLDLIFGVGGVAWWTVPAIAMTTSQQTLNEADAPPQSWRMAIVGLYWAAAGLFLVTALVALIEILGGLARCCCGGRRRRRHDSSKDIDVEYGH